jgi:hypothetical protein
MVYNLRFFSLQNAVCFIILTYLVPILFTFYIQGVLKLKKNNSGTKRLNLVLYCLVFISVTNQLDAQNVCFTIGLFRASTCFEHMCSLSGGQNCIIQPLVSSHLRWPQATRSYSQATRSDSQLYKFFGLVESTVTLHG